jgi:hypothetical protein
MMEEALMRLGLSDVALQEFTDIGIDSLECLRILSQEGLEHLIQQICFWTNRMHFLGIPHEIDQVTNELAMSWNLACKAEMEAAWTP